MEINHEFEDVPFDRKGPIPEMTPAPEICSHKATKSTKISPVSHGVGEGETSRLVQVYFLFQGKIVHGVPAMSAQFPWQAK